jgi:hypothetical protein
VQVRVEAGQPFIPLAPGPWQIHTADESGRITFRSYYEAGWMEPEAGRGELTLRPEGDPENFLRVWYAWRCLREGAVLLHAAGAVRAGRGYVFFGPSGAGKTTTARLSLAAGCTVLSDDLVILKKSGGGWQVCGVPFRGELPEAPRTNLSAPAAGLFVLVKHPEHQVAPAPFAEAVARLAACVPFVMRRPAGARAVAAICGELAAAVPVHYLRFRRDPGFWEILDGNQ